MNQFFSLPANVLVVTLLMSLMFIADAFFNKYIILAQGSGYEYDKLWHRWQWIFHALAAATLAYASGDLVKIPLWVFLRWTVFQNILNVLRMGWGSFFYLGDGNSDGIIKRLLGKNAGFIWFLICVSVLILIHLYYFGIIF